MEQPNKSQLRTLAPKKINKTNAITKKLIKYQKGVKEKFFELLR